MMDDSSLENRYKRFAFSPRFIHIYERFHRWSLLFLIGGGVVLLFWFSLFISVFTEFSYGRIFGGIVCFMFSVGFLLFGLFCIMIGWNSRKWHAMQQHQSAYSYTVDDMTAAHGRAPNGRNSAGVDPGSNPGGGIAPDRPPPPYSTNDAKQELGNDGNKTSPARGPGPEQPGGTTNTEVKTFYPVLPTGHSLDEIDPIDDLDEQDNPYAPTTYPISGPQPLLPTGGTGVGSSPSRGPASGGSARAKAGQQAEPLIGDQNKDPSN